MGVIRLQMPGIHRALLPSTNSHMLGILRGLHACGACTWQHGAPCSPVGSCALYVCALVVASSLCASCIVLSCLRLRSSLCVLFFSLAFACSLWLRASTCFISLGFGLCLSILPCVSLGCPSRPLSFLEGLGLSFGFSSGCAVALWFLGLAFWLFVLGVGALSRKNKKFSRCAAFCLNGMRCRAPKGRGKELSAKAKKNWSCFGSVK